ncbi:MAG TPA: hypothetical protein DEB46_09615 [Myxococcales bacterium]|nr:hypothetical protein [Myxococcales bacterium]
MRTSNPTFNENRWAQTRVAPGQGTMTVQGTVNKTGIMTLLAILGAGYTFTTFNEVLYRTQDPTAAFGAVSTLTWGGAIAGFVTALIISFKPGIAPVLAPVYAVLKGLFLGGISAFAELRFPGVASQATFLTLGILAALLICFKAGIIKVTQGFRSMVFAATGGIFFVYLISFVLSFFGQSIPLIHGSGMVGIGFSLFVVAIASMNLVMDFDFIDRAAKTGQPKHMEWFGAFAVMVTLFWLYLEILRLLMKLQSRR